MIVLYLQHCERSRCVLLKFSLWYDLRLCRCDIRKLCFATYLSVARLRICPRSSVLRSVGKLEHGFLLITTTGACILAAGAICQDIIGGSSDIQYWYVGRTGNDYPVPNFEASGCKYDLWRVEFGEYWSTCPVIMPTVSNAINRGPAWHTLATQVPPVMSETKQFNDRYHVCMRVHMLHGFYFTM